MKDDEELEMLLDEIPHATSHHHNHHHVHKHVVDNNNHVNGSFYHHGMCHMMHDDDNNNNISSHYYSHNNACTSPVSGLSLHSDGSSSSLFSNNGDDNLKPPPQPPLLSNGLFLNQTSSIRTKAITSDSLSEMGVFRNFGSSTKMYNDHEGFGSSFRDFGVESNGMIHQSPVAPMAFSGFPQSNLLGMNLWNGTMRQKKEQTFGFHHQGGISVSDLSNLSNLTSSLSKLSMNDALIYGQRNGQERFQSSFHGSPRLIQANPQNIEDSFIIQGEGLNYVINKGSGGYSRIENKGSSLAEISVSKRHERAQIGTGCGNAKNDKLYSPLCSSTKYNSLAEARGYIYLIAKDQHGCRFLQRLFDEGTKHDVEMIFNEIIDHVVELMMNPFGNYLVQKLLEVCDEEQRMRILLMVTEEPGQLVRISLNTHGTRVVQKLIETLKTRQQISLVISALEPGFLSLIKDLNGNHVVQRCLQCLSSEDNNFIFDAAAMYCVDIATHQHGCCVLQRCISHSSGEYQKKLVEEISTNGLLLSQDAYGNYVVQFILELKIPSATSTLLSQFEGNYVHLSSQKFSSHVVEKCLIVLSDDGRSRIIRELLSATHFEQLLQDPHANYVVQTAVRVSEGRLHNLLVEAIESHKAISRNSPYSKRIFSQKLLKK